MAIIKINEHFSIEVNDTNVKLYSRNRLWVDSPLYENLFVAIYKRLSELEKAIGVKSESSESVKQAVLKYCEKDLPLGHKPLDGAKNVYNDDLDS